MLNYNDWLMGKLVRIARDNGLDFLKFHIFSEQDFTKAPQLKKNDIFIVIKHLTANISFNTRTEPLQMMVLSNENELESAILVFKLFANQNNFITTIDGSNYIKHQYTEPAVISNFTQVGIGYRSILYVSATLYTMENVVDIVDVKIDGESVIPVGFSWAYNLQTDTQPFSGSNFVKSVRMAQTLGFSMTLPAKNSNFMQKMLRIIGDKTSGDVRFSLSFKIKNCDIDFTFNDLLLSGHNFTTAPNDIPTITIGLVL